MLTIAYFLEVAVKALYTLLIPILTACNTYSRAHMGPVASSAGAQKVNATPQKSDLELANEKDRAEFAAICAGPSDTETAYTIEMLQDEYQLKGCEETFHFLITTPNISLINSSRYSYEFNNIPENTKSRNIIDISIFRFARSLINLNLYFNAVTDLTPLKDLQSLRSLLLRGNDIRDLSPLSGLTNLKTLDLEANKNISNPQPLASLANLETLNLNFTKIVDLSFLSSLRNLKSLALSTRNIDLSPLLQLPQLSSLDIARTGQAELNVIGKMSRLTYLRTITDPDPDCSFLAGLVNLEKLFLFATGGDADLSYVSKLGKLKLLSTGVYRTGPVDVARVQTYYNSFSALKNLEELHINDNAITSYPFISLLTNLHTLTLSGNGPNDIASIAGLKGIKRLSIRIFSSEDLNQLRGLPQLESLELSGFPGTTFPALGSLKSLKHLRLSYFDSIDFRELALLSGLESLFLENITTPISDISPLNALSKLKGLAIRFSKGNISFAGMSGLSNLRALMLNEGPSMTNGGPQVLSNLEYAELGNQTVEACYALAGIQKLRSLGLSGSNLQDLSCVKGLTSLVSLRVPLNPNLSNISDVNGLTKLEVLDISGSRVSDLSPLRGMRYLETLKLSASAVADFMPLQNNARLANLTFDATPIASLTMSDSNCPKNAASSALRVICSP